ncbi:hypothetical protein LguiB_013131 [Lonicera macranthoides]
MRNKNIVPNILRTYNRLKGMSSKMSLVSIQNWKIVRNATTTHEEQKYSP